MHPDPYTLDREAIRVLGCLIEKAMTTPDQYPMSLNGVRVACNQVSNREPVVDYDETTVSQALRRLGDRGLAKMVHRQGDRVVKYIHAADSVFELDDKQVALVAVLMLRGDQTPGELRQRTSRYVDFASLAEVEATVAELEHRSPPLVEELTRMPGQKEHRYEQLLGETRGETPSGSATRDNGVEPVTAQLPVRDDLELRVEELADQVAALRTRFDRLLTELGVDDG